MIVWVGLTPDDRQLAEVLWILGSFALLIVNGVPLKIQCHSFYFFSKALRSNDSSLKVIFILLLHKIEWKSLNLLCFVIAYQKNDLRHRLLSAVPPYIAIALILIFRYQTLAWFVSPVVQHQEFVYCSCKEACTACTKQYIYQSVHHSSLLISKQHHQWWNCLLICCPFVRYLRGTSTSWGLLDRKASAITVVGPSE